MELSKVAKILCHLWAVSEGYDVGEYVVNHQDSDSIYESYAVITDVLIRSKSTFTITDRVARSNVFIEYEKIYSENEIDLSEEDLKLMFDLLGLAPTWTQVIGERPSDFKLQTDFTQDWHSFARLEL